METAAREMDICLWNMLEQAGRQASTSPELMMGEVWSVAQLLQSEGWRGSHIRSRRK
jgi:hypothetical protein